jgi:hypothetical protein
VPAIEEAERIVGVAYVVSLDLQAVMELETRHVWPWAAVQPFCRYPSDPLLLTRKQTLVPDY